MKMYAEAFTEGDKSFVELYLPDLSSPINLSIYDINWERTASYMTEIFNESVYFDNQYKDANDIIKLEIPKIFTDDFRIYAEDINTYWIQRDFNFSSTESGKDGIEVTGAGDLTFNNRLVEGPNILAFCQKDVIPERSTAKIIKGDALVGWAIAEPWLFVENEYSEGWSYAGLIFSKFIWVDGPPASQESFILSINATGRNGSIRRTETPIVMSSSSISSPLINKYSILDESFSFKAIPESLI